LTTTEFQNIWQSKIEDEVLKSFPEEFINGDDFEVIDLPGKPLLKGSELFGNFEIIDTDGDVLLSTDNIYKIKYILYANRSKPSQLKIPTNDNELVSAVKSYEKHLDEIVRMINLDFKKQFPTSDEAVKVSSKIFQLLNLHRH
jgi:hypothetical protein